MKLKKIGKRLISVLIVLTMLTGILPMSTISTFAATVGSEVRGVGLKVQGLLYANSNYKSGFENACSNGSYQFVIISTTLSNSEFDYAYNLAKNNGKKVGVLSVGVGSAVVSNYLSGKKIDLPVFFTDQLNMSSGFHKSYPSDYFGNKSRMESLDYVCGCVYSGTSSEYTFGAGWNADNTNNNDIYFTDSANQNYANYNNGNATIYSSRSMDQWKSIIEDNHKNGFVEAAKHLYLGDDFYAYIVVYGNRTNPVHKGKALSHDTNITGSSSKSANAAVAEPDYTDTKQIWHFRKYNYDNNYEIMPYDLEKANSDQEYNFYLNVAGGAVMNGAGGNVVVTDWPERNGHPGKVDTASIWKIYAHDNGGYYLQPAMSGDKKQNTVLNIANESTVPEGYNAGLFNIKDNNSEMNDAFRIIKIQEVEKTRALDKPVGISNPLNSDTKIVTDSDHSVKFGTYPYSESSAWTFERANEGTYPPIYYVKNNETGEYMQVDSNNDSGCQYTINTGTKLSATDNEADKQKWILSGEDLSAVSFLPVYYSKNREYALDYDVYTAIPKDRSKIFLSMDVPGWNNKVGQVLLTWATNFANPQLFTIKDIRYSVDKGDFYSSIKSLAPKGASDPYSAISLSYDGLQNDRTSYGDGIAGVKFRKISDTAAADQEWYFKSLGDGSYAIQNVANGYYLHADDTTDDRKIRAYRDFENTDNFKWYVVVEPNGNYSISSKTDFNSNLNAYGNNVSDGTDIKYYGADGTAASLWLLDFSKTSTVWAEDLGDTFWAYISPASDSTKYLHCTDATGSGNPVSFITTTDETVKRQQENYWKFVRNEDGSYSIASCNLVNAVLNKNGDFEADTSNANNVYLDNEFGAEYTSYITYITNHRWFIRKYAGGYKLECKMNGQVFTINGDSLQTAKNDSSNTSQLFNIIKTDLSVESDLPNVKMRLFNYGKQINNPSYDYYKGEESQKNNTRVLHFFNGSENITQNGQYYVDTASGNINSYDYKPTMLPTLNSAGYPEVTGNTDTKEGSTGSLQYLFDDKAGDSTGFVSGNGSATSYNLPSTNYATDSDYQSQCFTVNNPSSLFKYNSNNGLYYYDSLINAAYFQRDTDSSGKMLNKGNFKLYDYTMTVPLANKGDFDYRYVRLDGDNPESKTITGMSNFTGNFYPFNKAHEEGIVDYGSLNYDKEKYKDLGTRQTVSSTYAALPNAYFSDGDLVPVNYSMTSDSVIDCWFGMTLECDFEQTSDGSFDGKPVQFNFKGDDDVWVYLDGVLVLNIGGTHKAYEGSINFQTGDVIDPEHPADANGKATTNLRELYEAVAGNGYSFNDTPINEDYIENNFNAEDDLENKIYKNTFKSGTKHTLNFYYMERGGAVSSCSLNFNLPKGTPSVTKKVTNANSDLTDNTEYEFKLEQKLGENKYQPFSAELGITYTLENADGSGTTEETLNADGTFKLKANQTAYFHNIDNGMEYRFVEINARNYSDTTADYITNEDGSSKKTTGVGGYEGNNYVSPDTILKTKVTQNTIFYNTLETSSLTIDKDVLASDGETVDSMPDATYNFGLRVYNGNMEYGTINFSIKGSQLDQGYKIDNLPAGASYDLWEYYPNDTENRYSLPTFVDDKNSSNKVTGRLVETSNSPAKNDVITGKISGNTIKVTNKLIADQYINLTLKYYDRKVVSGEVANIDEQETAFSKQVKLDGSNATISNNKITAINMEQIITDAGVSLNKAVVNVVDDYELYTSQSTASNAVVDYTYTLGEKDDFATHKITADQAVYHTNSKRQPITDVSQQEKWVTYYQSGTAVDAEAENFIDFDKITNITVWLYNKPHKYKVTTHVPDGTDKNGKTIYYEAYYNQLLGSYYGNTSDSNSDIGLDGTGFKNEYEYYCTTYSIPKDDYDARGYTLNSDGSKSTERYETAGAAETFNNQEFSHWTDGTGVISTDRKYNFRVTLDRELFAQYGEAVKGVYTTNDGIDTYYTSDGVEKLRLNTVMNPYGFPNGINTGNPDITETAVVYLTLNETGKSLTLDDVQLKELRDYITEKLNNFNYGGAAKKTETYQDIKVTVDSTETVIGYLMITAYQINDTVKLTNKNRIQFVANYTAATNRGRKMLAFTSLKYNSKNTNENGWYVSDNYAVHEFTNSIKTSAFTGDTIWADANPSNAKTTLSLVKMYQKADNEYYFYMPTSANLNSLPIYFSGYNSVKIGEQIINSGTRYSFVENKAYKLYLNNAEAGTLTFMQSSTPTLYLQTDESFPVTTNAVSSDGTSLSDKDNFSTSGTYAASENGTFKTGTVSKIKGRGNASWTESFKYFGKYSYNITLEEEAQPFNKLNTGTKYCLLANNCDESMLRNTTAFTLAQKLGLAYTPTFQYVDVYDNGDYMGSYLMTDKIEVSKQSVNLQNNLDDLNKKANKDSGGIKNQPRTSTNGNINDNTTAGYKKWVAATEPTTEPKDGAYLLELEFGDRFVNEISGFISNKGQHVVVKSPEYATKNQIDFIAAKFQAAEDAIYDIDSTLEDIDKLIDVDSFIKAYLIQEISKNLDAGDSSFYIYYDPTDGKLHAGPVWDFDNSFGQYQTQRTIVSRSGFDPAIIDANYANSDEWYANIKCMNSNKEILNFEAMLMSHGDVWDRMRVIWNTGYTMTNGTTVNAFSNTLWGYHEYDTEGTLTYYINEVKKCAEMNESRWGFISKDLLSDRTDTGDTFDTTSTALRNYIDGRRGWLADGIDNYTPLNYQKITIPDGLSKITNEFDGMTAYIWNQACGIDVVVNDSNMYPKYGLDKYWNVVVGGPKKYDSNNHRWIFNVVDSDNGIYKIQNQLTETYLTAFGEISTDGRMNVCATAYNGSDSQKWQILKDSSGKYVLKALSTNAVLDVSSGSLATSGTNVWTYGYSSNNTAQQFTIES